MKLDATDGDESGWTRQLRTGVPRPDYAQAVDSDGNVYVAGYTYGTLPGQTSSA